MSMLYTLSYPEVSAEQAASIESFRRDHDLPHGPDVAAHFTLVFGCAAVPEQKYVRHVEWIAATSKAIAFSCRYAMPSADHSDHRGHVFLIPDEGYSAISSLHDKLYTGPLAPFLNLALPYIPHITIATVKDLKEAKMLCDKLNAKGIRVDGHLRSATVGALVNGKFCNLSSHQFDA